MFRTFAVVVAIAALAVAGPSLAAQKAPEQQQASGVADSGGGSGPAAPLVSSGTQPVSGDVQYVTGVVVMTTPTEIVLHTDKGMERFALSPQMQNSYVPVEGDTVTLGVVPGATGSVRVTTIQRAAAATTAPATSTNDNGTTSTGTGSQEAMTTGDSQQPPAATKPDTSPAQAEPVSATAGESTTAAPATAQVQQHAARLPKTASNRPLILLIGVLALAGAGVMRFAARA